jgi:predicted ATPase with chaperone activity
MVTKYQKRISGPMLGRIDIHVEVLRVEYEKLSGDRLGETSETIRKRVQVAREIQSQRFNGALSTYCVVPANISGTGNRRKMVFSWMPIASPGRCAGFDSRLFLAW